MSLVTIDPRDRTPIYAQLRSGAARGRGVGSFISASGRSEARTAAERARRLRAFATRVLADAEAAGFTLGDVLAERATHRQKGA